MKQVWISKGFEEVFQDCSGGSAKVPQSLYASSGSYAVVDQGQTLIAGYVEDPLLLCKTPSPAIIFGDHTRALKYVDFPFCMGADGIKVLKPRIQADVKYLYHYLRSQNIPEAGYSRHYKYLKRIKIALPPPAEQRRIAAILDQAEALRAKRRQALAKLDTLTQSLFLEMFGDPRKPEILGSEPTDPVRLGDLVRIRTGKKDANAANAHGMYPFFTCSSKPLRIEAPSFCAEAILVAGNGDLNVKYFNGEFDAYQRTYVIESLDKEKALPRFLHVFLELYVSELRKLSIGGVIKYIKLANLTEAVVGLPALSSQQAFMQRVDRIEKLGQSVANSNHAVDTLFHSLQHKAFRGEL